jgi:phospholipid/cholesterol/gamma-HCH transport system substrate-binding protein
VVAIAGVLGALALLALVLLATGAGEGSKSYEVRAIFDDAANIISGEDVKIEGAKVGVVGNVTPTPEQTAAVVLHIENPGFQDFRADASCTIEPEALIGEKFVNCRPTQPRAVGTPLPPPLNKIPSGHEGEGQYLLPVQNTSSPVDTDLLNDINRLPVRERLTIIINEFGAGLAGRGSDLNAVIRRANPALRELNQVLGILAHQNKLLAKLALDSDVALQPLPRIKEHISNFIVSSDKVARASANQRGNIAKNFAKFPAFLEQLGRSMEANVPFAEETTRTFTALKPAAPGINKLFANLGPFSNSSTEFFESLGKTAKRAGPALVALDPLLAKAKKLGTAAKPFSSSLAELFTSLRDTGGLERIMDFIFLGTGTTNGYDALGHFLRAEGVANSCITFALEPKSGCGAKFFATTGAAEEGAEASRASASKANPSQTSLVMQRTLAVLKGETPTQALAQYPGSAAAPGGSPLASLSQGSTGAQPGSTGSQPVGGSSAGTTYYTPSKESNEANGMLLNYLLGN